MSQMLSKLPYNVFGKAVRNTFKTMPMWRTIEQDDIYYVDIRCTRNCSPKNNERRFGYKNNAPYKVRIRGVYYKLTVLYFYRYSPLMWRYNFVLTPLYSKEQQRLGI